MGDLCMVYIVLQIKYLQHICNRYLQRSNCLFINILRAFCCRWQMFRHFQLYGRKNTRTNRTPNSTVVTKAMIRNIVLLINLAC